MLFIVTKTKYATSPGPTLAHQQTMKRLILIAFLFAFSLKSNGQARFDTSWVISKSKFTALLVGGNSDTSTDATLSLIRDNKVIFVDSIAVSNHYFKLEDINTDGFVDLKVYCCSGARANEVFYLYLYNIKTNRYLKVDGFEDWPNLTKTHVKGLLVATILTGIVTYRFFQITSAGELIDLNISVEDENLDGKEYDAGVSLAKKKMHRP